MRTFIQITHCDYLHFNSSVGYEADEPFFVSTSVYVLPSGCVVMWSQCFDYDFIKFPEILSCCLDVTLVNHPRLPGLILSSQPSRLEQTNQDWKHILRLILYILSDLHMYGSSRIYLHASVALPSSKNYFRLPPQNVLSPSCCNLTETLNLLVSIGQDAPMPVCLWCPVVCWPLSQLTGHYCILNSSDGPSSALSLVWACEWSAWGM